MDLLFGQPASRQPLLARKSCGRSEGGTERPFVFRSIWSLAIAGESQSS